MRGKAMDRFDKHLLLLVQQDCDLTAEKMAEQVGLSASAVQRRLKRLKTEGIIQSVVAVVDPAKVGQPTFFVVGLEIERERPELLLGLKAWLSAEERVQQAFYVTGSWDFILIVAASDIAEYEQLTAQLMADNPNVRRFTTNVALSVPKRTLFVPINFT